MAALVTFRCTAAVYDVRDATGGTGDGEGVVHSSLYSNRAD